MILELILPLSLVLPGLWLLQLARVKVSDITRAKHVKLLKPLGYRDMLKLMSEAELILTDSGGIQKEAFGLKFHV